MEGLGEDIVSLLKYLTPGFLAAWIFYGLTSQTTPSQFERIIQALIFTFIISVGISIIGEVHYLIAGTYAWRDWLNRNLVTSSTIGALFVGFLSSYLTNTDWLHRTFRWLRLTVETSYPSEWFSLFSKNQVYVVLHLQDDRRVYGWPREWPSDPMQGHFALEQASWLEEGGKETRLTQVRTLLIDVKDVRWVEFMEPSEGQK